MNLKEKIYGNNNETEKSRMSNQFGWCCNPMYLALCTGYIKEFNKQKDKFCINSDIVGRPAKTIKCCPFCGTKIELSMLLVNEIKNRG